MYKILQLDEFDAWLSSLKDSTTRGRFVARLKKAEKGNLGDIRPVGEGVQEMREHFGSGWRMYYVQHGKTIIVMLGGGTKSTQSKDINQAKILAKMLEIDL